MPIMWILLRNECVAVFTPQECTWYISLELMSDCTRCGVMRVIYELRLKTSCYFRLVVSQ
jgi:hypothetical protein